MQRHRKQFYCSFLPKKLFFSEIQATVPAVKPNDPSKSEDDFPLVVTETGGN